MDHPQGLGRAVGRAGSIIFHSECQVRYAMGCLATLLRDGHTTIECRPEVLAAYNERFDARHARLVWSHTGTTSWYKNPAGKILITSPWLLVEYWGWTRTPDLADFDLR